MAKASAPERVALTVRKEDLGVDVLQIVGDAAAKNHEAHKEFENRRLEALAKDEERRGMKRPKIPTLKPALTRAAGPAVKK